MTPGEYAVINRQWRYISYGEDGEELYDVRKDPHEWENLANDPSYDEIKNSLRKVAPKVFAPQEAKYNVRNDLVIEGETFRWSKGNGTAKKKRPAKKSSESKEKRSTPSG